MKLPTFDHFLLLMKAFLFLVVCLPISAFAQSTDSLEIQFNQFIRNFEPLQLPLEINQEMGEVSIDSLQQVRVEDADAIILQDYVTKSAQQQTAYYFGGSIQLLPNCHVVLYYVEHSRLYPIAMLAVYTMDGDLKGEVEVGNHNFFSNGGGQTFRQSMISEGANDHLFVFTSQVAGERRLDGTYRSYEEVALHEIDQDCKMTTLYKR